jgi:hypothetical protein
MADIASKKLFFQVVTETVVYVHVTDIDNR